MGKAIDWLADAFGFSLRWRIGTHRAQMNVGDGAIAVTERGSGKPGSPDHVSVMVRVEDVSRHHGRAKKRGARILQPPTEFPYGERQYTVENLGGHVWTFSESIDDVAPEDWGGASGQL